MNTHPDNRIMVDGLEDELNQKLHTLEVILRVCDKRRDKDRSKLANDPRQRILELACDFPRLWNDPATRGLHLEWTMFISLPLKSRKD